MSFNRKYIQGRILQSMGFGAFAAGAPTSGQYFCMQLWNPAGSGKNAIVHRVSVVGTQSTATGYVLAGTVSQISGTVSNIQNKFFGGAFPASVITFGSVSAIPGNSYVLGMVTTALPAFEMMQEDDCVVVTPGFGLNLISLTANTQTWANIAWVEEIPS